MKAALIAILTTLFSINLFAQTNLVSRFKAEQLNFSLHSSSTGESIGCTHELLSHVPWWKVRCGTREFTVDTWLQLHYAPERQMSKVTLMYHVSEGVKSSGLPLVQFNNHFTSIIVSTLTDIESISSSLDVQNGQASLVVVAQSQIF